MSLPVNRKDVFVIIPAYNEQDIIKQVIGELLPFGYTVIVVDDGSLVDLQEWLAGLPVLVLRHPVNLGQGAALQTGIEYALSANAGYIVTFDADGQHEAKDIEQLLAPLRDGEADITLGSRFLENRSRIPSGRRMLLKTARLVNFLFTGLLLTDAHNGLRALNRTAASKIRLRQAGMAHATEIIAEIKKKQLRYRELPVTIHYTDYSRKKGQTIWGSFRIFFDILLNKIFR